MVVLMSRVSESEKRSSSEEEKERRHGTKEEGGGSSTLGGETKGNSPFLLVGPKLVTSVSVGRRSCLTERLLFVEPGITLSGNVSELLMNRRRKSSERRRTMGGSRRVEDYTESFEERGLRVVLIHFSVRAPDCGSDENGREERRRGTKRRGREGGGQRDLSF